MITRQELYSNCKEIGSDAYNAICNAVAIATSKFDVGYCTERACEIRRLLGKGALATFSICGFSRTEKDKHINELSKYRYLDDTVIDHIKIPYDCNVYNGEIEWAYHTVYVYQHKKYINTGRLINRPYVITAELQYPVLLRDYRMMLDELNLDKLQLINKKHIAMRGEKFKYLTNN